MPTLRTRKVVNDVEECTKSVISSHRSKMNTRNTRSRRSIVRQGSSSTSSSSDSEVEFDQSDSSPEKKMKGTVWRKRKVPLPQRNVQEEDVPPKVTTPPPPPTPELEVEQKDPLRMETEEIKEVYDKSPNNDHITSSVPLTSLEPASTFTWTSGSSTSSTDAAVADDSAVVDLTLAEEALVPASDSLYRGYKETRKLGEEYAMEFVCNEIRHPVITCFRELNGPDINHLLSTNKMKKMMGTVPVSLVYMGLIDYMASTINNPLYFDESKKPMKNIPAKVAKIMSEMKPIISSWGVSDSGVFRKRYEVVTNFLTSQIPLFQSINFHEDFETILNTITTDITRNKLKYEFMKSSYLTTTPNKPSEDCKFEKTTTNVNDQSESNDVVMMDVNDDEDDVPSNRSFNLIPQNPYPIVNDEGRKKFGKLFSPSQSKVKNKKSAPRNVPNGGITRVASSTVNDKTTNGVDKDDKVQEKKSTDEHATKTPLNASDINNTPASPTKKGDPVKSTPSNKKPRLELPEATETENMSGSMNSPLQDTVVVPKPKINAFALLMSRSKEIAHQKKQQKLSDSSAGLKIHVAH